MILTGNVSDDESCMGEQNSKLHALCFTYHTETPNLGVLMSDQTSLGPEKV